VKILKVIADEKPEMCIYCAIHNSCKLGVFKQNIGTHKDFMGTWEVSGTVPGDKCPIEIRENREKEILLKN
jgi:hypothetical protein